MVDAYRQPELAPLYRADREDEGDKVVIRDNLEGEEISLWDARGKDIVPLSLHTADRRYEEGEDDDFVNGAGTSGEEDQGWSGVSCATGR